MNAIILAVIIVSVIGIIAGIGLSFASVALEVPVDEKMVSARGLLPGANCGGCGYTGCDSYAEAVAKGEAEPNLCAPGGADVAKSLSELIGVDAGEYVQKVAYVHCNGGCENTAKKYEYRGIKSCAAVNSLMGGDISCAFGCLGIGDCAKACSEKGIVINSNGVAEIDHDSCVGCGNCVTACPKGIIELIPKANTAVQVKCNSTEKGASARKACKVACIGCGICTKQCEFDAIHVENNLAVIDTEKCTKCGKCAEKCPQKCIIIE